MKNKFALVICDGLLSDFVYLKKRVLETSFSIACDGAANQLIKQNIIPNLVIGDLDSFDFSLAKPQIKIVKDTDQETNDLEKALLYAFKEGFSHIEIVGALGKRLDHTLKNLSVLLQFDSKFEWVFIRDEFGISFIAATKNEFTTKLGTLVSLVPLSGKVEGITTQGLAFSLHNEPLENGKRDGTSNETISENITILKGKGDLLLLIGDTLQNPYEFIRRSKG